MAEPSNDIAQIITAISALVAAMGSSVAVILSLKQSRKIDDQKTQIDEVHRATNGLTAQLLKVTGESERAKGVIQGEENLKNRS